MSRERKSNVAVQEARAHLVLQGDSLHAWSRRRGFHDAYVHLVLRGKRQGPRARTILQALRQDGVAV